MKYKCEWPNCSYTTTTRKEINYHHIQQSSYGGSDKKFNRIWLCPNHHSKVYIPESKSGIHSIKGTNSIIILKWVYSTSGKILHYIDINGIEQYHQSK